MAGELEASIGINYNVTHSLVNNSSGVPISSSVIDNVYIHFWV